MSWFRRKATPEPIQAGPITGWSIASQRGR